jgi:hypothetical protein
MARVGAKPNTLEESEMTMVVEEVQPKKTAKRAKQSDDAIRKAAAVQIRKLTKSWGENSVALGLEFLKVRETFPQKGSNGGRRAAQHAERPGWRDWIEANTDWSVRQVNTFIRVAERFGTRKLSPVLSQRVLEFLAREHVPEEAVEAVMARAGNGEQVTREQAEEIAAKEPRPKKRRCNRRSLPEVDAEIEWQRAIRYRADKSISEAKFHEKWLLPYLPKPDVIIAAWQASDAWKTLAEFLETVSGLSSDELAEIQNARGQRE